MRAIRLFFATDLHGSSVCFRKFLAAKDFYQVDTLILGGDLTGKAAVAIVESNGKYRAMSAQGKAELLKNESAASAYAKQATSVGLYPVFLSDDEYQEVSGDPTAWYRLERKLIRDRLKEWVMFCKSKVPPTAHIYFCPGNDDDPEDDDLVCQIPGLVNIDCKLIEIEAGLWIAGLGGSPPTPWDTPREYTETELAERLSIVRPTAADSSHFVFCAHAPPYNSGLDLAPSLDTSLKQRVAPGMLPKTPVGSSSVKDFIYEVNPDVGLFGHVHDSRGEVMLGNTRCVNPGSTYSEATLSGAIVEFRRGHPPSVQLTCG